MEMLVGQHFSAEVDVTDLESLRSAVEQQSDPVAPLRGVMAVAGIEVVGSVLDLEPSSWQRSLDVNLTGVFNTAKAAMPSLMDGGGSFVAMSSDAGHVGAQGYSAYCAAKHGVIGLIKAMALDHGPSGVRSNAVAPSFVQTPMADRIFENDQSEMDYYAGTIRLAGSPRPRKSPPLPSTWSATMPRTRTAWSTGSTGAVPLATSSDPRLDEDELAYADHAVHELDIVVGDVARRQVTMGVEP